jgi:hypothetical protein
MELTADIVKIQRIRSVGREAGESGTVCCAFVRPLSRALPKRSEGDKADRLVYGIPDDALPFPLCLRRYISRGSILARASLFLPLDE